MTYQVITGTVKARTAVHVGSGASGDLTDALIRRDAAGQPIIPGTAIAGALRALATRLAPRLGLGDKMCAALTGSNDSCDCAVCHLFGDINPSDAEGATSEASRLLAFNARLNDDAPNTLIRDGVGVNRVTGAAARAGGVKFDLEVLPAGSAFELRLELRDVGPKDKQLLAAVLAEWRAGRAWLGGNVARGLGGFALQEIQYKAHPLNNPDALLAFLKEDEPWHTAKPWEGWLDKQLGEIEITSQENIEQKEGTQDILSYVARCWITIEGTLQAQGALLTNDATTAGLTGFDHAPLLAQLGEWQYPVLAGSGLRGVLRSHAERIARTLATRNAGGEDEFLRKCPACSPVESRPGEPLASCDVLLKGKVSTNDEVSDEHLCLACRLFGSTRRGSRLIVEDAPYEPTEMQAEPVLKMLDFLAIDRFTGGGAERLKFDALALWKPAFRLHLHLENPAPWELGWLALVVRDLQEGWLSVGFGMAKGFGRVRLKHPQFTLGYLSPDDIEDLGLAAGGKRRGTSYTEMPVSFDQVQPWVDQFLETVDQVHRGNNGLPELQADSYFGQEPDLTLLYPSEVTL